MVVGETKNLNDYLKIQVNITDLENIHIYINNRSVVTNENQVGYFNIFAVNEGATTITVTVEYQGNKYSTNCNVLVRAKPSEGPTELDEQTIRIYKTAERNEKLPIKEDITDEEVELFVNEWIDIEATKTKDRDILNAVSGDSNKVRVINWNGDDNTAVVKGQSQTLEEDVPIIVHGSIPLKGTTNVARANFDCKVKQQNFTAESIVIGVGETKRVGLDDEADYKITALNEEFIYEIYKIRSGDDNFATVDGDTGELTGLKEGKAILHITGKRSGATADILVTVVDNRSIYYATLHTNGTLGIALTEEKSKISGLNPEKTYNITLSNEHQFIENNEENNKVKEVIFVDPITISAKRIYWFNKWPNLEKIQNENYLNTENITNMSEMFFKCSKLTGNLNLSTWNTSNVQYMDHMFDACNSLEGLNVSTWNTSQVRNMENMFYNCSSLKEIEANRVGDIWNTGYVGKVESSSDNTNVNYIEGGMREMFANCTNLKNASLKNWNTENVQTMENMFMNCTSLQNLDINSWNTRNVKNVRYMFSDCTSLSGLNMNCAGDEWNVSNVETFEKMFNNCSSMTYLNVNNWDIRKASTIEYMFAECTALKSLDLSTWKTSSQTEHMFNVFQNDRSLQALNLTGWNFGSNVGSMFNGCESLTTEGFKIAQVNTTSTTNMNNMFDKCSGLTEIKLDTLNNYWNVSNVVNMRNMFYGCTNAKTISLKNWNVQNVTTMGSMFIYCQNLDNIDLSTWKTGNKTEDMSRMFYDCESLQTLNLTGLIKSGVKTVSNMFDRCSSLTYFNWNLWGWDFATVEDMSGMFSATGLIEITLDLNNVKGAPNLKTIENLFRSCGKLSKITMTNWNVPKLENMYQIFMAGGKVVVGKDGKEEVARGPENSLKQVTLTNWNIPSIANVEKNKETITPIDQINALFYVQPNLEEVNISNWILPNSVEGELKLFQYSEKLKTVTMNIWQSNKINKINNMYKGCKSIEDVTMNNLQMSAVTDLSRLFVGRTEAERTIITVDENGQTKKVVEPESLKSVTMNNWLQDNNVTDMSDMFRNRSELTSVTISSWKAESLKNMSFMFEKCSKLRNVSIKDLNTPILEDMYGMFRECTSLDNPTISNINTAKVNDMRYMFYCCTSLKSIDLRTWNTESLSMDKINRMFFNYPIGEDGKPDTSKDPEPTLEMIKVNRLDESNIFYKAYYDYRTATENIYNNLYQCPRYKVYGHIIKETSRYTYAWNKDITFSTR